MQEKILDLEHALELKNLIQMKNYDEIIAKYN